MKPWIKDTIKESKLGYLVYQSQEQMRTIPFPYEYRQGRLVSYFSVLLADILRDIQRSPSVVLVLHKDDITVTLKVKIDILVDRLQISHKTEVSSTHSYFSNEFETLKNVDHFNKQVELILTPRVISAVSREEKVNYELEIL